LFRLKKVQGKKKRDHAAAELEKRNAGEVELSQEPHPYEEGDDGSGNLLSTKDEDVIF
jgi:V-type H+-transporting ATPase subunit D